MLPLRRHRHNARWRARFSIQSQTRQFPTPWSPSSGSATGFRFTDAGGNFRVDGVPCGAHSISVAKPGFVSEDELSRRQSPLAFLEQAARDQEDEHPPGPPEPAVQMVNIEPGSLPARIRLVPDSSIAGSVRNENGEPLPGVVLQAISVKASLDGTDYVPAKTANTDDRGRYSLLDPSPRRLYRASGGRGLRHELFPGNQAEPQQRSPRDAAGLLSQRRDAILGSSDTPGRRRAREHRFPAGYRAGLRHQWLARRFLAAGMDSYATVSGG